MTLNSLFHEVSERESRHLFNVLIFIKVNVAAFSFGRIDFPDKKIIDEAKHIFKRSHHLRESGFGNIPEKLLLSFFGRKSQIEISLFNLGSPVESICLYKKICILVYLGANSFQTLTYFRLGQFLITS